MAVPGRPDTEGFENESGEVDRMSVEGMVREMESRERREKMVLRVSKRGRMTVSRYAVRTMRRTSNAWEAGMFPAPLLEGVDGKAPQKSRACSFDMRVPEPENSKSKGRKTA